ncbi:glycosyltransferase [Clostridium estertheticum]|uniref:Glycosyltransferase n=1 Tax=Clostridium estertheticum TaxID=238834 RepID=A0A5N7ISJ4_9CLOT|nr:glycosyltransferase [Clostridium estertheticum]MPQ33288.1 glycosyltransferase [Clostridium estertheticum]MPQ63946.1 glycosyltransferase [Clostridium estertheticum]
MNKCLVLHILASNKYSGAENVATTIISNMNRTDDYKGVYVSPRGSIEKTLKNMNVKYEGIEKLTCREIRRVVKKLNPDIIHAHDFRTSIICWLSGIKLPIISHIHNNPPWIKKINPLSFMYWISSYRYSKIILVSDAIIKEYIFAKSIKNKIYIIGNPNNLDRIKVLSNKKDIEERYDVIFIGRLTKQKNPLRFIDIISESSKEFPLIKVAMIGDGELKEECEDHIKERKLTKNIKLFGFLDNPYAILKHSKVMIMTSDWEGYGLVAIEAMSLGIPVLATPVGGLVDIVDNEWGRICNSNSEFVEELKNLILDEWYLKSKSQASLKKVVDFDNLNRYMSNLESIYLKINDDRNKK